MDLIPATCPKCSGQLQVPKDLKTAHCMYCGTEIIISETQVHIAGDLNVTGGVIPCPECGGYGTYPCPSCAEINLLRQQNIMLSSELASLENDEEQPEEVEVVKEGSCTTCGGSGKCEYCSGNGVCNQCKGTGEYCWSCKKTGKCTSCQGRGKVGGLFGTACPICGGSGVCSHCKGKFICAACKGTGKCRCKGENKCQECDGTGHCLVCDGSGKIKCDFCNGTGKR